MSPALPFAPHFHDERAAYAFVEASLWPEGPVCPHCGGRDRSGRLGGLSTRPGLYKCYQCRKPFTVKLGTMFESSNVKLHLWLRALYLLCGSRSRVSSTTLHQSLGVTVKTAWSMRQRIQEAIRQGTFPDRLVAALGNGRRTMPTGTGMGKAVVKPSRSWSTSWNTPVDQDRFTRQPSIARAGSGTWWIGRVAGGLE